MNLCGGCCTVKAVQRTTTTPGVRQDTLRRHNLGLVLREVLEAPIPPSRADVAVRTGLTRATVSALVDRLIAAGMLTELPPVTSRRAGRPAVPLVAAGGTFAAIGLEINVSYLGGRAVDLSGQTLTERLEVHDFHQSSPSQALDLLASIAREMLEDVTASGVCVLRSPRWTWWSSATRRTLPRGARPVHTGNPDQAFSTSPVRLVSAVVSSTTGRCSKGDEAGVASWGTRRSSQTARTVPADLAGAWSGTPAVMPSWRPPGSTR
jgi:hypothetical protein